MIGKIRRYRPLEKWDLCSYWVESGNIIYLPSIRLLISLRVMITPFLNASNTCFRITRILVHKWMDSFAVTPLIAIEGEMTYHSSVIS